MAEQTPGRQVCGSRGPRIGQDGQPRCAQWLGHNGEHRGFFGSGFENVTWGDPVLRDVEFVEGWTGSPEGTMQTVFVTIGNTDDRLGQKAWSTFVNDVDEVVRMLAPRIHGRFYSDPKAPWQNACWSFDIRADEMDRARAYLANVAANHHQDSIAWSPASTEFITRDWEPTPTEPIRLKERP